MELSDRLKMIAECAVSSDFFVDVGTDHAYIPIYLYKKGLIKRAVACDISKGSVLKADKNIEKYGCSNFIETRLGDGLMVIKDYEEPDEVVISGMGGMLTIDIIENSANVVKNLKRLILQPQRDIENVRRIIHKLGFKIVYENMICEERKYYNVIVAEKGNDYKYSEIEYEFGKILIESKNHFLKEYIIYESNKMDNILLSMAKFDFEKEENRHIYNRFCDIQNKNNMYKGVVACL